RGELAVEETGGRPEPGQTDLTGRTEKKVLRPSRKRGMVDNIRMEYNISIQRCCKLVLLHKSVFYYKAKGRRSDQLLRMRMNEIASVRVRYGFWRIHILLRREGFMDNHKRMYRVYCEEGLNLRSKRPKRNRSAAHRQPGEGNASNLNECWSMDFVRDQLYNGNRFRALTVVDNFSRKCLAIHAGKSLKGSDVVGIMERLTEQAGCRPERIKVDNGSGPSVKYWTNGHMKTRWNLTSQGPESLRITLSSRASTAHSGTSA